MPIIQIDGNTNDIGGDGLDLAPGSNHSRIRGLDIFGFAAGAGIHVQSAFDAIQNNYLGTDATGTVAGPGNLNGVLIDNTSSNTVGGSAAVGNLISGNSVGLLVQGASALSNVITGNLIGTTAAGTSSPGNAGDGVQLTGGASDNTIGTPAAGMANTIAFNVGFGVDASEGTGNAIRGNSIYDNTAGGINLSDSANNGQSAPTLNYATTFSGTTLIQGQSLGDFTPGATYAIDFFASASSDPAGSDQAHLYLGSESIQADASGNLNINASFATTVPVNQVITATATSATGNTSEISSAITVLSPFLVNTTVDSTETTSLRQAILNVDADVSNPNPDTISFAIGTVPATITLTGGLLPAITHPVILDGTTQSGYAGAPVIAINGNGITGAGIELSGNSGGSTIKGLDIVDFVGAGIDVETGSNTVQSNYVGINFAGQRWTGEPDGHPDQRHRQRDRRHERRGGQCDRVQHGRRREREFGQRRFDSQQFDLRQRLGDRAPIGHQP